MNATKGIGTHAKHRQVTMCPTCDSPISRERYEQILRINTAREERLAHDRAQLHAEREQLEKERSDIETTAAAAERTAWEERLAKERAESASRLKEVCTEMERERARVDEHVAMESRKAEVLVSRLQRDLKVVEERRHRDEEQWKRVVEELKRKVEARDAAHFGAEGEADLLAHLRAAFPGDRLEHRSKKGDVLHTVMEGGSVAGVIVYESKKRKDWDRAYVRGLKKDMEVHDTKYGVLVCRTLPPKCAGVCVTHGVIVTSPTLAAQVVEVLRSGIVALARLRLSEKGKDAKSEALLEYLSGEEFSNAIARIAEKLGELNEALGRERSFHQGWWRTREQHYASILREMSGVDGRVKDILGDRRIASLARARSRRTLRAAAT